MLRIVDLGNVEYEKALHIQQVIQKQRIEGKCDDTLLLLEHPPVLTKGIRGKDEHILVSEEFLNSQGVKIHESKRGGDVTYLGPGQMIGYVIMDISNRNRDIRKLVQTIEQAIINILFSEFGIESYVGNKKYTGVFVELNKIAAIGIAVNKRVTMHGFALNVNTNLEHFEWIVPCGLHDRGVTSIERLTGHTFDRHKMVGLIKEEFQKLFETEIYTVNKEKLLLGLQTEMIGAL